jgi:hypothetical protein
MKQSYNPDIAINKFIQKKSLQILNKNIIEIKNRKNKFYFDEGPNGHRKSPDLCICY